MGNVGLKILELVCVGLVVAGVWLIYPPLAFIVGGVVGLSIIVNVERTRNVATNSDGPTGPS